MEALRDELGPHGVHVACVYPPDVDTPQLAEENRYKPAETFAISGSLKPMTADAVADAVLRGMDRRRFAIYPNAETRVSPPRPLPWPRSFVGWSTARSAAPAASRRALRQSARRRRRGRP